MLIFDAGFPLTKSEDIMSLQTILLFVILLVFAIFASYILGFLHLPATLHFVLSGIIAFFCGYVAPRVIR